MFLSLPASVALIVGSEQIISALFGYGSFDELSVSNSANALYYFGLGLPAFALIKVFSTFFFANQDTKTPFYISLISVILNILISVYFFREIGFIIIPIATTISSWFNAIILFVYLKNKDLFDFSKLFFTLLMRKMLFSLKCSHTSHTCSSYSLSKCFVLHISCSINSRNISFSRVWFGNQISFIIHF